MNILKSVYKHILLCPNVPPEIGGILGSKDNVICDFEFDIGTNITESAVYEPNIDKLNAKIVEWEKDDIMFCGMFHSHLISQPGLSTDDTRYINTILNSMPKNIESLFFPIVLPKVKILSYKAMRKHDGIDICEDIIKII
ncbi:MAG: hypothetical protein ACI4JG_08835 [Acutalibacteraceae bacterium]